MPDHATRMARISLATASMASALADARLVLVAVPASGHAEVARAAAPFLRDGQSVLLVPGRTGGAEIVMAKKLPLPENLEPNGQGGQGASPHQGA